MGLRLVLQPRPLCPALYAISVRRLGTLPAASFRFHLAMDTLAVRLTLPTTKRVMDFHHQAIAHGGRTIKQCADSQHRRIVLDGITIDVARYLLFIYDVLVIVPSSASVETASHHTGFSCPPPSGLPDSAYAQSENSAMPLWSDRRISHRHNTIYSNPR